MFAQQTLETAWQQVRRRGPAKDRNRPLDLDEFPTRRQREAMARADASCVLPPQQQPPPSPPHLPQQQPQMVMMEEQLLPGPWATPEFLAQAHAMMGFACHEYEARTQYLESINGLVVILQQDVAAKSITISSLAKENTELRRRISSRLAPPPPPSEMIMAKMASMETELARSSAKVASLEAGLARSSAKVASLEVELAKSKAEVAETEEQNHKMAVRCVDRLDEIEQLKAELASCANENEEVVKLQAEVDRARGDVSCIEAKNLELMVDLDVAQDKLKKAESEAKSLKIANSLLHQVFEERTKELKRATAELEQLKAAQSKGGELTALKDKAAGLAENNKKLKEDLSAYKQQLWSTLEECKIRDKANKESTRRVDEQNSRIAFLQRRLEEADARMSRLQQERTAKVGAINELWEKAVETATGIEAGPEVARLHADLARVVDELAKSQSHCQTLMTLNRRLMTGI